MIWKEIELADVCEIGRGSSPRPINNRAYFDGGKIPWIKIADATSSVKVIYKTKEYVNSYGASFSRLLPIDSLIVAASGTLGFPMFLGVEGCIHDGWLYFKSYNGIDKDFLYYKIIDLNKYFYSKAYGAAIQNINTDTLRRTRINLPPIEIQKRIANILSTYDDLIENNLKRIKLLEETAQHIYKEWFVNFRFPNYEHTEFDEVSGLPVAWFSSNVGNFTDVNKSSINNKTAPQNLLYIDISSTNTGFYENPVNYKFEDAPSRARRIVKNGDSIFSTVRPNRKTYAYISNPEDNLIVSTGFAVLSPKNINDSSYIYLMISSDNFVDRVSNIATGVAYPAINQKDFESIEIIVPTEKLREQFNNTVSSSFLMKSTLLKQNQKLKEARDILLPRLMNKTIEV